ncbi:MAG: YeeE/YedE family protein, partial [Afipia sp.]
PVIVFVAAMAAGMIGFDAWSKQKAATPDRSAAAIATSTDG